MRNRIILMIFSGRGCTIRKSGGDAESGRCGSGQDATPARMQSRRCVYMQLLFTVPKVYCLDGGCGAGDRASDSIVAWGQGKHFLGPSDIEKVDN